MVTVPIRLPHRFSNPFDEEAVFINTATPGFFIRYFEYLEGLIGEGKVLTPEVNKAALLRFASIPLTKDDVELFEKSGQPGGEDTQKEEVALSKDEVVSNSATPLVENGTAVLAS